MATRREWDENDELTSWINIPGLTIVNGIQTDADYFGFYDPIETPRCPSCGHIGNRNSFYSPRTVYHLVENRDNIEGEGRGRKVVSIEFQCQKYICPICYQRKTSELLSYEPEFARKNATATTALSDYIGPQCLDRDSEKVAENIDGLGKDAVKTIFQNWAKDKISAYADMLAAPKALGLHLITVAKKQYYLLTDITDGLLIDIFQANDYLGVVERLTGLAMIQHTADALTEIDRQYVVMMRGLFRRDAVIRAAVASICMALADEIVTEMEQRYGGRGEKAITRWLLTPVYEDQAAEPEVSRIIRQSPIGTYAWLGNGLIDYRRLREVASGRWTQSDFDAWLSHTRWVSPPHGKFAEALTYAKDEIDHSFEKTDLQRSYNDTEKLAREIIQKHQKCKFDLLRYRLLLKCNPKMAGFNIGGALKYFYRGVSVTELAATLKDYDQ